MLSEKKHYEKTICYCEPKKEEWGTIYKYTLAYRIDQKIIKIVTIVERKQWRR